jgi:hypothetical protein
MALSDMRVVEQDLSAGDLSLDARDGESLEILARGISGTDPDTTIEEYIREELMLAYQHDQGDETVFMEETVRRQHRDILGYLRDMGLRVPMLSVPEGQTYTLASSTETGTATVLYREMGVGSAGQGRPGGPETKSRSFISSGRITETVASGTTETPDVDTSVQPAQLDGFPFAEDCPPNREYDLQAMMLSLSGGSGANVSLDSFKVTSDETDFLARQSSVVDPGLAQYPNAELTTVPMVFVDEPTFSPGADLDVTVTVSNSGSGDEDAVVDCSILFYRRSV